MKPWGHLFGHKIGLENLYRVRLVRLTIINDFLLGLVKKVTLVAGRRHQETLLSFFNFSVDFIWNEGRIKFLHSLVKAQFPSIKLRSFLKRFSNRRSHLFRIKFRYLCLHDLWPYCNKVFDCSLRWQATTRRYRSHPDHNIISSLFTNAITSLSWISRIEFLCRCCKLFIGIDANPFESFHLPLKLLFLLGNHRQELPGLEVKLMMNGKVWS